MKKYYTFLFFCIPICLSAQINKPDFEKLFYNKQYASILFESDINYPYSLSDYYFAALAAEAIEDFSLAQFYFSNCLRLDSTFVEAKMGLANALFVNEEILMAIEIYSNLLQTDTLNAFFWSRVGDCYSKLYLAPIAYSCYQNAFYLNPKNSSITLKLITTLSSIKKEDYVEEALFYCDSSLFYNCSFKPLQRKKAHLYMLQKEYLKADTMFQDLLCRGDSSFLVLKFAGICQGLQKKNENAIKLLRKAHSINANDVELMLHFAAALSTKPECFEEHFTIIEQIRKEAEPDSAVLYQTSHLLANSYLGIKDTTNAIINYYFSMNKDNEADRLVRVGNLSNNVSVYGNQTITWYFHYYYLQNFSKNFEKNGVLQRQRSYSRFVLGELLSYMHQSGKKSVVWQTFVGKSQTFSYEDIHKIIKK